MAKSNLFSTSIKIVFTLLLACIVAVDFTGQAGAVEPANPSDLPLPCGSLVDPLVIPNDTNVPVTITGTSLSYTQRARLGQYDLWDVDIINDTTLTALVHWGMPPGTYSLTLANADLQECVTPNAAQVIAGSTEWVTNGPYGGKINSLTLDPQNPQKLYAAVTRSGVYASPDGATNWQVSWLAAWPRRLVVSHSGGDDLLYIGTEAGMQRSEDGGANWETAIPAEVDDWMSTNPYLFSPAVHPGQPEAVYLGVSGDSGVNAHGGLFQSGDRGVTWTKLSSDTHVLSVALDPQNAQKIYFASRNGKVYASQDGGANWSGGVAVAGRVDRVVVDPFTNLSGSHDVWALDSTTSDPAQALFRSQDEGATFSPVALPNTKTAISLTFHDEIPGTLYVALGNGTGWSSANYGSTWTQISGIPAASRIVDFAVAPDPLDPSNPATTTLYAGTYTGVFKSLDGGATWAEANTGMQGIVPTSIAYNPANPDEAYAAAVGWNVLRTGDGGRTWLATGVPSYGNSGSKVAVGSSSPFALYATAACDWMPCLRTSLDAGATYSEETLPVPPGLPVDSTGISMAVAVDPNNAGRMLVGAGYFDDSGNPSSGGIFRRADSSSAWALVSTPAGQVQQLVYDPRNTLNVYAGTGDGPYASHDGGLTWTKISNWPGTAWPGPIAVAPYDSQTIFAYGGGIYRSKNGGTSWTKLTSFTGSVKDMRFMPQGTHELYIATQVGLKRTLDEGQTMEDIGGLPGKANVQSLAFGADGLRVVRYVGTTGGYVTTPAAALLASQLKGGGVYRNAVIYHGLYLPLVRR